MKKEKTAGQYIELTPELQRLREQILKEVNISREQTQKAINDAVNVIYSHGANALFEQPKLLKEITCLFVQAVSLHSEYHVFKRIMEVALREVKPLDIAEVIIDLEENEKEKAFDFLQKYFNCADMPCEAVSLPETPAECEDERR